MFTRRLFLGVLVWASMAAPLPAQRPPEGLPAPRPVPSVPAGGKNAAPSLTLADLEQIALERNPTIAQTEALIRQEQGLMQQVGLYPNPTFGYVRTDSDAPGQTKSQGVFVGQEVVTGGKLRLNRAIENQEVLAHVWQLRAQRERVLNDVRIRYYDALGAQQAVRTTAQLLDLAEESVKSARELLKGKLVSRVDVLQAEIQAQAVRASLQTAQLRARGAWQQLAAAAGQPNLPCAPLAGNLEENLPELDYHTSLERLLTESPLLAQQQAFIRSARYGVERARAEPIPNLTVQVVAERDYIQNNTSVNTFLAIPLPIFNRNQGNIFNAQGRLAQQATEYERLQLALTDQLASTFQQYAIARTQVKQVRDEILPRARENLDLTRRAYRAGQFGILNLISAQQTYAQANLAYIDALTELHKRGIEISGLLLTGGLNPSEIGTALQAQAAGAAAGARNVLLQQLQQQGPATRGLLPGALQAGGP
jgi:cobalt-zinc-cadmium efflux system outer membrane protein